MQRSFSLVTEMGEWGCINIRIGKLQFLLGFIPELFGFDIHWGDRVLITTNNFFTLSIDSATFWQALVFVGLCGIIIVELVWLVR